MLFVIIEINLILKFKRMSILTSPNFTNLKKKKVLLAMKNTLHSLDVGLDHNFEKTEWCWY